MRCSGSAKPIPLAPRPAAQRLADHFNRVINTTVSDSRLSLLRMGPENLFLMARLNEAQQLIPIDLFGTSHKLLIQQIIRVEEDGHCQTASYRYRIETEGGTPLIRWEYDREPPREDYPYPLAHVHVHAEFSDGIDAAPLHISTDRVSLELVLWHLLSEPTWGLEPRIDEWGEILVASIEGFRERRTDLASTENDQA